jgi:hypothetical protein
MKNQSFKFKHVQLAMASRAVIFAFVAGAMACHAFVPSGKPLVLRRSTLSVLTRGEKTTARSSILGVNAGQWIHFSNQNFTCMILRTLRSRETLNNVSHFQF